MIEGDDDQVDLLGEKSSGANLDDFYQQEDQLNDLRNQISLNMPGVKGMGGMPGLS